MKCPAPSTTSTQAPGIRSAASVEAASGIGLREPWTKPTGTRICGRPASTAGIREGPGPDNTPPLEPHLLVDFARHRELVELAGPLANRLRGPAEHLLVE